MGTAVFKGLHMPGFDLPVKKWLDKKNKNRPYYKNCEC